MNTPEQDAIIQAVSGGGTVACNAVAGSGKTTTGRLAEDTLEKSLRRLNCAFSKRIAVEFERKMPAGSDNKTFNSLGFSSLRSIIPKPILKPNYGGREKSYEIIRIMGLDKDTFPDLDRVIGLAKNTGFVPPNTYGGAGLVDDTDENWQQMLDLYAVDYGKMEDSEAIEVSRHALATSIQMAFTDGTIDFDDQLYLPTLWGGQIPVYDFIFVDEAQDLSPIQHKMVYRMSRQGKAQILMAGDRNQAIYAFRGAMHDSFDIMQLELKAIPLPLTVSFRCAKAIVEEAQRWVPEIRWWGESPAGLVTDRSEWDHTDFRSGDTILCRNTKPLIPVFYELIANGVGAKILGSDIGKGLNTTLRSILKGSGERDLPSSRMAELVEKWGQDQYAKYVLKNEVKARMKREQASILVSILERHKTAQEAIQSIFLMFSDEIGPIMLSTIHKAKGLEWPRVFFLDRFLIPSSYATEPWELQQESNLAYVGVTRAMQELHYINSRR